MKDLQFKNFKIEKSEKAEAGGLIISGYGAFFDNVDSYGDVIKKGAFADTLERRKGRIAFCYQHDIWNPIGKIQSIEEDEKGLKISVKLSEAEKDIATKIEEGILEEMSIGYRTLSEEKEVINEVEVNALTKIELFEISLVTIAANPLARIDGMKSEEKLDLIEREFARLDAIIRNENIKFEINKLKSITLSALAETRKNEEPLKDEFEIGVDEIKQILLG